MHSSTVLNTLRERANKLDRTDALAHKASQFVEPAAPHYLDGNSLGLLPKRVAPRVNDVIEREWGQDAIKSWNSNDWIRLSARAASKIAPLIGCAAARVAVCDSISVNLFKALSMALADAAPRRVVLSTTNNFPTDLYMVQGVSQLLGRERCELKTVESADLLDHLNEEVAVLMLTQVDFRSGELLDIQSITAKAHEAGAKVIWDLAHSAGVIPLELDAWNVDYAVGCGYKYLNGGPGAPAFIALGKEHAASNAQPLFGWMGHAQPFAFDLDYHGAEQAQQLLVGTPNILSLAALDAALDVYEDVSIVDLRAKSLQLTGFFIESFKALTQDPATSKHLADFEISLTTTQARGSHVGLRHPDGFAISQALIDAGIIIDFRAPDLIRFGFAPLYNGFRDAATALEVLCDIMASGKYSDARFQERGTVT